MLWRRLAISLLVLASAACTAKKPPPDYFDLHPEETATTVDTPVTAPLGEQVKTVEAAQRLLDLFARLDGEAARMLLQKGAPDAEFDQTLQTAYVGTGLEAVREVFAEEAKGGFVGYARPQPNPVYRAKQIVDARRDDCVVVAGAVDLRPRYTTPITAVEGVFVLVVQTGITASGSNPTRWRILDAGPPTPDVVPEAICPGL